MEENHLTWAHPGNWISGGVANRPLGTNLTAIDALEALIDKFSDQRVYPSLSNITFVGQSAGGQLVQRFAAISKNRPSSRIHIRYVHNNPSSFSYFTYHRPRIEEGDQAADNSCPGYNTWRYGFDGFRGTSSGLKSPKEYFEQYITRDVIATVGYLDTNTTHGGQKCEEVLQGGGRRRDRSLIWYRYINQLARSCENLDGFPGEFDSLPDWSSATNNSVGLRLSVARTAGHKFMAVFATPVGRSALFEDFDVLPGWRP
jgi:pimeloyl-ACP methyl ester carboxylesterase